MGRCRYFLDGTKFSFHQSSAVVLKMWSLGQQLQHPPGTCQKCKLSGQIPDLLNKKLWVGPSNQMLTKSKGDSNASKWQRTKLVTLGNLQNYQCPSCSVAIKSKSLRLWPWHHYGFQHSSGTSTLVTESLPQKAFINPRDRKEPTNKNSKFSPPQQD